MQREFFSKGCGIGEGRLPISLFFTAIALFIHILATQALAFTDLPIFGPQRFDRLKGAPTVYTGTFDRCEPSDQAVLRVWNGEDKATRMSSAQIFVNGAEVAAENRFNKKIDYFEIPLTVDPKNDLRVVLKSGDFKEPAFLRIQVLGKNCDNTPPVISAPVPADGALLNTARPLIAAAYADEPKGSGIDPGSARLSVDGADVTASADIGISEASYTPSSPLPEGTHQVTLSVSDQAFNRSERSWSFTTDTIPPHTQITSNSDGQWLNTPTIAFSGSVDDPTAKITVNGAQAEVSGNSFRLASLALTEGSNTVTVVAVDPAGNSSTERIVLNLDTVPPVVIVTTPQPNIFINTPSIRVAGTVNEPVTQLQVDGRDAEVAAGAFSLAGLALTEGGNTVQVVARDRAGNETTVAVPLTLDTIPPVVNIAAPLADFLTNIPTVDVTGSVNEPVLSVTVDGLTAVVNGQQFSHAALALAEGENTIEVKAVDRAGNIGTATVQGALDTIPPTPPVLDQPPSPTNVINLSLSGSAEALSRVTLFAQGPDVSSPNPIGTAATDAGGHFAFSGAALTEGVTLFSATATDPAGNEGAFSTTVSVHRDTVAPVISAPAPADGSLLNSSRPALATSFADEVQGSGIDPAKVRLLLDGADVTAQAQVSAGAIQYQPAANLPEGGHTAVVQVSDLAGNPAESSWQFTTDTIPPVPAITSQSEGQYLNTPVVTVSGTLDDPTASVTVNGVVAAVIGNEFSLAGVSLVEGDNTLTVVATDPAGNVGIQKILIHLDTVPPVVTVAAPSEGFLTNIPTMDVTGSVNEPALSVAVNGLVATLNDLQFSRLAVGLVEKENIIEIQAVDRAGNVGTATVHGTLDTIPPDPPVLVQPPSPTNKAKTVLSGSSEALSKVTVFAQGPGLAAPQPVGTVDADATGHFSLADIPLVEGKTTFTASATDAAGNESAPSIATDVVLDTVAPVITVNAPANGAFSDDLDVHVSGSLSEPAVLTIDGTPVPVTGVDFDCPATLKPGDNTLILLATDPAGNTGTASLSVQVDNTPPTVTFSAPLDGTLTRTPSVTVSGSVSEPATLTLNGQPLTATDLSFSTLQTLAEGENTLTVSAVDRAGNAGSANLHVTLDSRPPTLTLTAPSEGTAGGNVALTLDAADDGGLEQVEVSAGGVPVWSANLEGAGSATRSVGYTLAPTLAKGTTVTLQASAVDRAGNPASATVDILVSQAAAGPGTIQGEVYDDRRGLLLAGADFAVLASDEAASGQTTDKGAYFAELPAGEYLVRLSKPGYTAVERTISVPSEQNAVPLDARLTPTETGSVKVPVPLPEPLKIAIPLDGGTPIELIIPVGALTEEVSLCATPVSNQGMMGVLPAGWSPLAVLDLRALDAVGALLSPAPVLAEPAALSIPLPEGLDASIAPDLVLTRYDEGRHQWIDVSPVSLDPDGLLAEASLTAMGQYALVIADPAPFAPPAAQQGQPLAADSDADPDFDTLSAAGRVVPPASPPPAKVDRRRRGGPHPAGRRRPPFLRGGGRRPHQRAIRSERRRLGPARRLCAGSSPLPHPLRHQPPAGRGRPDGRRGEPAHHFSRFSVPRLRFCRFAPRQGGGDDLAGRATGRWGDDGRSRRGASAER